MRSAAIAFALTVVTCVFLLAACFNKSKSTPPGYDGGYPDVLLPGVNLPDAGTKRYTVGGTVVGLRGTGLVLDGQGPTIHVGGMAYKLAESLAVAPGNNGANVPFTFQTAVPSGFPYTITVQTQPSNPTQNCMVMAGTGTVAHGNVIGVVVNCSTKSFVIGGTATGVEGSGLLLEDNGGDMISINTNGSFAFPKAIPSGSTYAVTVVASPNFPSETCTVSQGSGPVTTANITNVKVSCYPNVYNIGGTVVGLKGAGLVLTDNSTDNLSVTANGAFRFAVPVASGSPFSAQITTQPSSPAQQCTIAGQTGTVGSGDVSSIVVNCTANAYTVSGLVNNLAGNGLVLNTSAGSLSISSNGSFALPASLTTGTTYSVAIGIQPMNPTQMCTVTGGMGVIAGANVTNVIVDCSTNSFTIGGQVSGLAGNATVTLTDNGGDNLVVASNGGFTFATSVPSGSMYDVAVGTQPYGQECTVSNGGPALVAGASVSGVLVQCSAGDYCVDSQTDPNNCGACGRTCPAGQLCQGSNCVCAAGGDSQCHCANTLTDANNCGGCGRVCPAGLVCQGGSCACVGGETQCPSGCADTRTDANNCGRCNAKCPTGATCQTTTNSDGTFTRCVCPPPEVECNGVCVNETSDPNNCGGCTIAGAANYACPNGLTCANSSCCPAGQVMCPGGTCVDETMDPNCGACGVNCSQAGATCQASACVCPAAGDGGVQNYCPGTGCTDLTTDNNNCGSCGNACLTGATCQGGACVCPPTAAQTYCPGTGCTTPSTDKNNCGSCGNVCLGAATCQASACVCPPASGQTYCSPGGCTNTSTDIANCGGCNAPCGGTQPLCCSPDNTMCVDGSNDTNNCGTCGNVCPGDPNGSAACSSGTCEVTCNGTFIGCPANLPTACVDSTTNANCGSCGNVCGAPQTCQNGSGCGCGGGQTYCPGTNTCTNTSTDASNCGGCGTVCPVGVACQSGSCCPSGQALCDGTHCADVLADPGNCGRCGNVCPAGTTCTNGNCCSGGLILCNGLCVDRQTDPNNCGVCGNTCPAGGACQSGSCCGSGQLLCGPGAIHVSND